MELGRILLTGASGFVGRHVAARAELRNLTVIPFSGDLRDPAATGASVRAAAPDAVIHLAGRKPSPRSDCWALLADEIAMAGNLLRALGEAAPHAVMLVAGSAAQYGHGSPTPLPETAELRPTSPYGAIKTVLETACTAASMRGPVRVVWARTFNCLGPGQQLDTPAAHWARQVALAEAAGGGAIRTGSLEVVRDFLDVRDVADAYIALLASDFGGVVNVGSGEGTRLADLVRLFADQAQVEVGIETDPALKRAGDPPTVIAAADLLHSLVEWRPTWTLEQSVGDMLEDAR